MVTSSAPVAGAKLPANSRARIATGVRMPASCACGAGAPSHGFGGVRTRSVAAQDRAGARVADRRGSFETTGVAIDDAVDPSAQPYVECVERLRWWRAGKVGAGRHQWSAERLAQRDHLRMRAP